MQATMILLSALAHVKDEAMAFGVSLFDGCAIRLAPPPKTPLGALLKIAAFVQKLA